MTVSELVAALQGQSQDAQVAISSGGNTFDDVTVDVDVAADKVVLRSSTDTAVGGQSQSQAQQPPA